MSLNLSYWLFTRYDVCACNSLQDVTILFVFVTFSVCQGHFSFTIRCTLFCFILVPSMKLVGWIEFEILANVWRKINDVTMTSLPIQFYEIKIQIYQRYIWVTYQISSWSDKREPRSIVGKLTKNYEEKCILRHCACDLDLQQ